MNIFDAIKEELPSFSGICIREIDSDIKKVRQLRVSLAWRINRFRARNYKKILIIGGTSSDREYFTADIVSVNTINELYEQNIRPEGIKYQENIYGEWITERVNGVIKDNLLDERCAIVFENPSVIKKFNTPINFSRNSVYYIEEDNESGTNDYYGGEYIKINNFGKIANAKVKINGLTVITGVNDTGKSTTGKILFSLIKAVSRYKLDLKESKENRVEESLRLLYNDLRRSSANFDLLREEFHPNTFFNQIKNNTFFDDLDGALVQEMDELFEYKQNIVKNLSNSDSHIKLINNIKELIYSKYDKELQIKNALERVFYSEFFSEITPKGSANITKIEYVAGNSSLINVKIKKNKIESLEFKDDLTYQDVLLIETPLILQLFDLINFSSTTFDNNSSVHGRLSPKVAFHIKDLISKLEDSKYFNNLFFESDFDSDTILRNIYKIVGGAYSIDNKNQIEYINNKRQKIKTINTASGIKSFGIIQLLLQSNSINNKNLLIIDEPENHLHPEWQLKYAEMIVELVKNNVPIILTSHSPYMIQALKFYSEKENLSNKTSFYFTKTLEDQQQVNLEDVTDNLNVIFSKLAQPFKFLVWN